MSRSASIRFAAFQLAVIVILGGIAMVKGAFLVGQHEGDALHLAQIMVLLVEGWRPHQDFLTPIGYLAFWPIEIVMQAGLPMGKAFFVAQILVALMLVPAIWWVGVSRFTRGLAHLVALVVLVWVLGLVHGEFNATTALSMHYNRWAWAILALILFAALLPGTGVSRPWADALVIGVGFAALSLMKATFAVAFIPGVLVALWPDRRGVIWRALVAGIAFLASFTLLWGVEFWALYIGDLLNVMQSQIRPYPHRPFGNVVAAPDYVGATLLLIGAVVVLRHGGQRALGLAVLVLAPAFVYVTFQNFGNDPKWLPILALVLAATLPKPGAGALYGADLRQIQFAMVIAAVALNFPSLANIASSGWRNRTADIEDYTIMAPAKPVLADVLIPSSRAEKVDLLMAGEFEDRGVAHLAGVTERGNAVALNEKPLPLCRLHSGFVEYIKAYAAETTTLGVEAGQSVLVADIFSALWLYGDTAPVPGLSPWYYGGTPGLQNADYLSVSLCPLHEQSRKEIVEAAFARSDLNLTEVARGKMQILFRVSPAAN